MDDGGRTVDILTDLRAADGSRASYEELTERSNKIATGDVTLRLAALEDIIASKRWANRAKDREALKELERLRATGDKL